MPEFGSVRFTARFEHDIQDALVWSEQRFGAETADRYGDLIQQAILDVIADPARVGSRQRPEISPTAFTYHLLFSKAKHGQRVHRPRHFLLYRYAPAQLDFARLLHERRDLTRSSI